MYFSNFTFCCPSAKSSLPFSFLQMEVQEILGQLCKVVQLEIECMSKLKKGKSFECPRSVTSHRSFTSNTMSLVEANESGCDKYGTQIHSTPLCSPCSMPYCSPETGNQIIAQIPYMTQLGQSHSSKAWKAKDNIMGLEDMLCLLLCSHCKPRSGLFVATILKSQCPIPCFIVLRGKSGGSLLGPCVTMEAMEPQDPAVVRVDPTSLPFYP